jgi:hypothetical protein
MYGHDEMVYHSLAHKPDEPSIFTKFMSKITGSEHALATARTHITEGALAFRQSAEAVATGAVLGALNAKVGLDVKNVPIDAVLAVVGVGGAVALAGNGFEHDLRNIGTHSAAIFTFRQTDKLLRAKTGTAAVAGDANVSGNADVGAADSIENIVAKL